MELHIIHTSEHRDFNEQSSDGVGVPIIEKITYSLMRQFMVKHNVVYYK